MSIKKNKNGSFNYWELIGKISVVLTIIICIFEIYKFVFYKEYDINAEGKFSPYDTPERLFVDIKNFLNENDLKKIKKDDTLTKNKIYIKTLDFYNKILHDMDSLNYNIIPRVSEDLENIYSIVNLDNNSSSKDSILENEGLNNIISKLKRDLDYNCFLLNINVRNKGQKEIKDLKLEIPSSGYCKISEKEMIPGAPGYNYISSYFQRTINIGNLEQNEERKIFVWINKPIKKEYIKLYYPEGIVNIDFIEFEIL